MISYEYEEKINEQLTANYGKGDGCTCCVITRHGIPSRAAVAELSDDIDRLKGDK